MYLGHARAHDKRAPRRLSFKLGPLRVNDDPRVRMGVVNQEVPEVQLEKIMFTLILTCNRLLLIKSQKIEDSNKFIVCPMPIAAIAQSSK